MSGGALPGSSATGPHAGEERGARPDVPVGRPAPAAIRTAPAGPRELVLTLGVSLIAAAGLFGSHVTSGGRYVDDWWLGAYVRFPRALGFGSPYDYLSFYSGARPGAVAYWMATYGLFDFHDAWHRGLGVLLAAGLATAFYLLLRELRLRPREAAAVAALSLGLPIADSIHFWITPDVAQLCLATSAAGFLLALRGLRSSGRRARRLRLGALGLFVVSALIAETMLPAIGLSLLIYRTRVGWRRALAWWAADAVLVLVAGIHYALSAPERLSTNSDLQSYARHAVVLADQALTLFTGTLVPFVHSRGDVLAGLLVLGGLLRLAGRPSARGQHRREPMLPWVAAAGLSAVFAAASYAIYVPSDPSYQPLVPGIGNRVNVGALLPLSLLVFAIVRLAAGLCPGRRPAALLSGVLWAVVLVGGLIRLEADHRLWDQAAGHQRAVLAAVHAALPDPPVAASLIVLNAPGVVTHFEWVGDARVNEPVPVFSTWWELDAAVKLSYGRADLNAYPIWSYQPAQIACGAHYVYQLGLDSVRHALDYGTVYVVDVAARRAVRLDDRAECAAVLAKARTVRFDLPS
jgi:hypothetical protein